MKLVWSCLVVFLCFAAISPLAAEQGPCTRDTVTGTYVFQATGSSAIVTGASPVPGDPVHWATLYAPVAITGLFAFQPNGEMEGYLWSVMGRANGGLNRVPVRGRMSELDSDSCIAIVEFRVPVSATETFLVKDVMFIRDGGKEMWSLGWESPVDTVVWTGSAKLVSRSVTPAAACGQQMMEGRYLMRCQGMFALDVTAPVLSAATIFKLEISRTGEYSGWWYGRSGIPLSMPVSGVLRVDGDCSVYGTMTSPFMPGLQNIGQGVVFSEGKEAFYQPLTNRMPNGQEILQPYGVCQMVRVER